MATNKRSLAARKRKLANAFDAFDSMFGEGVSVGSDSHKPDNYGSHLDDLIIAQEEARRAKIRRELEMESAIFYIENARLGFQDKSCAFCGAFFSHTYIAVAYCSERCRSAKLNSLGIEYNLEGKTEGERWNAGGKGWIPKILGPHAMAAIMKLVHGYMEEVTKDPTLASLREVASDSDQDT